MFALIAIFGPSIIGLKVIDYLLKGLDIKKSIYYLIILLTFSLVFNNFFAYLLFHVESGVLSFLNDLPIFFCKYVIVSIIVNIILALALVVVLKNVSIELEVLENDKKRKIKNIPKKNRKISKKNTAK